MFCDYLQVPEREEELEFSVPVRQDALLGSEGERRVDDDQDMKGRFE